VGRRSCAWGNSSTAFAEGRGLSLRFALSRICLNSAFTVRIVGRAAGECAQHFIMRSRSADGQEGETKGRSPCSISCIRPRMFGGLQRNSGRLPKGRCRAKTSQMNIPNMYTSLAPIRKDEHAQTTPPPFRTNTVALICEVS